MDTDAFVHHSIARQIILSPKDLSIHWVWLPLFHYLSAGAILLGANMDTIRFFNIFIWAIIPLILFFHLYKQGFENNCSIAFISSLICAVFPIGILMGTTAQPEPLFTLLLLLFIISVENNKYFFSSIILALACMLRYEAWAVLIVCLVFYLFESLKIKNLFNRKIIILILPVLSILIWALLRVPFDGKFFGFLFQTQQFANDALKESNSFQGGIVKIFWDFIHYPIFVPAIFMGINIIFVPFGFRDCLKSNKWLLYTGIGILIFITLSWMFKSNLGLNRHFVALIPLYSALTAFGILKLINYFNNKTDKAGLIKKINVKYALLIIVFTSCTIYLVMWLYIWNKNFVDVYTEKKSTAEFLKNIPEKKTIFCNDAIVEILSGIDFHRFNRTWMENNPGINDIISEKVESEDFVYIVIYNDKWRIIKNIGEIIYQSPANKETNNNILILKVRK